MNYHLVIPFFLLLFFIPTSSYEENYTVNTNEHTISVTINPNYTITIPENNTETMNILKDILKNQELQNSKIVELVEDITKQQERSWSYGDVLVGSASIVGLFSISSFVTTRFSDNTKAISAPLLSIAIFVSALIMVVHLYIMTSIVTGFFNKPLYDLAMILTISAVFFVAITISKIVAIEHRGKRRKPKVELNTEIAKIFAKYKKENDS